MPDHAVSLVAPRQLPTSLRSMLIGHAAFRPRRAPRGKILIRENDMADHSILLLSGWVSLSKTLPSGDVQIIDLMLPGDFALVGTRMVPVAATTMEALSDIEYVQIGPEEANGPGAPAETLRHVMAALILTTQSRTSELLLRVGRGTAANRIAYALLEIYTRLQAVGLTDGDSFDFPITQQKFGEFTGLTNVHVCRTLRRFETDGLIAYPEHQRIELLDLHALCLVGDVDLDLLRQEILITWPVPA